MTILQKGDLSATSFSNNNTANAGGIVIRTDAGSTVGDAIATAVAGAGGGPALTNTAPSTSSTTAATPAFVNAAITAAGVGSGPTLTNAAAYPSTSDTTAATPAFVNAAVSAAGGTPSLATTSAPGIVQLTDAAPSTSSTTAATPAFVNAAITAAGSAGAISYATSAEIAAASGWPHKAVAADDLNNALFSGIQHQVTFVSVGTYAVRGVNNATSSQAYGVLGEINNHTGNASAVTGLQNSSGAAVDSAGVSGSNVAHGFGVAGLSRGAAVYGAQYLESGTSSHPTPAGVVGINLGGANNVVGVLGVTGLTAAASGSGTSTIKALAGANGTRLAAVEVVTSGANTTWGVYSDKAMTAPAFTISSDERLKRNIVELDGARAFEFAKALKFKTYVKLASPKSAVEVEAVTRAHLKSEIAKLKDEIEKVAGEKEGDEAAIRKRLSALRQQIAAHRDDLDVLRVRNSDEELRIGQEVGVIAQEVKALTDKDFPEFAFLVQLSDPTDKDSFLTVDMNSLQNIILAAVQYKLFA